MNCKFLIVLEVLRLEIVKELFQQRTVQCVVLEQPIKNKTLKLDVVVLPRV